MCCVLVGVPAWPKEAEVTRKCKNAVPKVQLLCLLAYRLVILIILTHFSKQRAIV